MKPIHVLGMGPDSRELAPRQAQRIASAQVLVGGEKLLGRFEGHPARKIPIRSPLGEVLEVVKKEAGRGKDVVVLADGDPGFFGIGRSLIDALGKEAVVLHPAVTTLQAAASRLKIPWQDIQAVSLHGRTDMMPLLRLLVRKDKVAVYTGPDFGPGRVAEELLRRGVDTFHMHVFENLGEESERMRCLELKKAAGERFFSPNFVVLERRKRPGIPLCLGLDDERYLHQRGLITKREVRAVGLSALEIEPVHTVWDLGSGCGAVAIEASVLAHCGRVLAVERDPERVGFIRENIRRTGAYVVEVVQGEMPECLGSLPDPDRVFIGGGMGKGDGLLEEVMRRVKPGGKVVLHLVLLGSLSKARDLLGAQGWPFSITQVQAGRSKSLASDLRFEALNPVYVVRATRPLD